MNFNFGRASIFLITFKPFFIEFETSACPLKETGPDNYSYLNSLDFIHLTV